MTERTCKVCGDGFASTGNGGAEQVYCSKRCQNIACLRRYRSKTAQATCKHCGQTFITTKASDRVYCSDDCHYAYKAKRYAILYRTLSADARRPIPSLIRRYIMERDEWSCHICDGRISKRLQSPHPDSATIDHLLPLAAGGTNEIDNLAAAHRRCNLAKGAGTAPRGDQLRLIG